MSLTRPGPSYGSRQNTLENHHHHGHKGSVIGPTGSQGSVIGPPPRCSFSKLHTFFHYGENLGFRRENNPSYFFYFLAETVHQGTTTVWQELLQDQERLPATQGYGKISHSLLNNPLFSPEWTLLLY